MKLCKNLAILIFASSMVLLNFGAAFAQTSETFDIISFKAPKNWVKKPAEGAVQFTKEDKAKGTYCLMTLYKSIPGTPNAKENFDLAWTSLVKEMVTVADAPKMEPAAKDEGWEIHSGYAAFESDGNKGIVVLVTASGFDKMVNLMILTNTDAYEKEVSSFLESLKLKKPQTAAPPAVNKGDNTEIVGTWGINASEKTGYSSNNYMISGYVHRQYTFNADGTYAFYMKTYQMFADKMFLTKETGTYQVSSGNTITVNPEKGVTEAWSRQGSSDVWGKKLSTQKLALEKASYQFKKEYFSEANEWKLFLQAPQQTKRDGSYSFAANNSWAYILVSPARPGLKLPGE